MITYDEIKSKQLQNDEVRKEYEDLQPEMEIVRAIIDARISQNMTQKELAERTGISQVAISQLENGTGNPTLNILKQLAEGMGMTLRIEFIPKNTEDAE